MKLTYFRGKVPNFGDELNVFLWDKLLPSGFLDEDEADLFLGVGSIIWDHLPKESVKHIIGSGYGGYTPKPDVTTDDWHIAWVRGPLTAQILGIDPAYAITDAAVLLRAIELPEAIPGIGTAFMPHFESIERGNWEKVCALAGITLLDPRDNAMNLIAKIKGADLLITEAMHGAIVADALRIPYIPITPNHPKHRMKWLDWSQSLEIDLRSSEAIPSSLREYYIQATGLNGQGNKVKAVLDHRLLLPAHRFIEERAAGKLQSIAQSVTPHLSKDHTLEIATSRCLEALESFCRHRRHNLK